MVIIEGVSSYSILSFCVIMFGYIIQTSTLQFLFYYARGKSANTWKIQSEKLSHVGVMYGPPIISEKPNRGKYHWQLVSFNLLVASCFALFTTEMSVTGRNNMKFDSVSSHGVLNIAMETILAITYQSIVEYYWHRMMHLKQFYKVFHKYHHFYKSPEPYDDMYIHPAEAFGYYCILYGPPFLFSIHWTSFIAYMLVMGLCGVLDHCGVRLSIPGLYDTVDHDNHHALFEVNYSFPFPYMDLLHGTYEGEFLGRHYSRKQKTDRKQL